ncbi:hypothetical protein ACO0LF_19430 [Undibacterium sp. Di27W]|uniref:hypothetical protein n=1 Tax=Undibacterium sp. Di27W TaxID=3413036 RepID=UPI003BF3256F
MDSKDSNTNGLVFPINGFLVGFDVYDREETFDPELNRYDPNKLEDLTELFNKYYFGSSNDLSKENKVQAFKALEVALKDREYDFSSLLCDHADFNSIYLPSEWKIENPRQFFKNIYHIVRDKWKEEFFSLGYCTLVLTEFD